MIPFLNASLPAMMQLNRSESSMSLPWSNGSLLSGRLIPATDGVGALLLLGQYRLKAEVPPNVPMGKVWLELIRGEKPLQFRLLSEQQAQLFVMDLLQKHQKKLLSNHPILQDLAQQKVEGFKLPAELMPYVVEQHYHRLHLIHPEDGQSRGYVQQEATPDGFMLYGRLELPQMGLVAFSLSGSEHGVWDIHIHLQNKQRTYTFEHQFNDWLKEQELMYDVAFAGHLLEGIPESMGSSTTHYQV